MKIWKKFSTAAVIAAAAILFVITPHRADANTAGEKELAGGGVGSVSDGVRRLVGLTIITNFPAGINPKTGNHEEAVDLVFSQEHVEERLNRPGGLDGTAAGGSIRDYFLEASNGMLDYSNIVTTVTADYPFNFYFNRGDRNFSAELITEILGKVGALVENGKLNIDSLSTEIQSDGSERMIALNFLHDIPAGSTLTSGNATGRSPGYTLSANGRVIRATRFQRTHYPRIFNLFQPVFAHENGHMLFGWNHTNNYCIMSATGSFSYAYPPNPYYRYLEGWVNVIDITGMNSAALSLNANGNTVYYYSRNGYEGFYIETIRRRTPISESFPREGLAVWYINMQRDHGNDDDNNEDKIGQSSLVALVQADNAAAFPSSPPGNDALFRAPDRTSFSGTSTPAAKYYDGTLSGIDISEISAVGDVMTFKFTNPNPYTILNNVPYIDESGARKTVDNVTVIDRNNIDKIGYLNGWYLVRGNLQRNTTLRVSGKAHIILEDGSKLTITGSETVNTGFGQAAGIHVSKSNSLAIYAQSANENSMGILTVSGGYRSAGIGSGGRAVSLPRDDCGTITISGGKVTATGGDRSAGIGGGNDGTGGVISISGGIVTATGGASAAGIGGSRNNTGGAITIRGGTITATGGNNGAGIGGGTTGSGGTILISGGTVAATGGGNNGAGIGGGSNSAGGTITINSGTVTATGGNNGAGIGGGSNGASGTITISGGTITATGARNGAGIGGGNLGAGGTIAINDGTVTAIGGQNSPGIGSGSGGAGGNIAINGGTVTATSTNAKGAGIGTGLNSANEGAILTMNGNAVVFVSSLKNNKNVETNTNGVRSGILFVGTAGTFYGTNITLSQNVTIPSGHTLTIPISATLTVPAGVTFIDNGKITVDGRINRGR